MADNKLLLKRASEDEYLTEDDPLAELARLVGFEQAPAANLTSPAQRREPVFDLEDELLKELEIYAQPAAVDRDVAVPAASAPAVEPEAAFAPAVEAFEPHFAVEPTSETEAAFEDEPQFEAAAELEAEYEPTRQPVVLEAVETFSTASEEQVYERPASHPVFDLEDEILREFSAFDARRVSHVEDLPVSADVIHQHPPAIETAAPETVPVELHDVPDSRSTLASAIHGRDIYESFRDDDLDDAISNATATQAVETQMAPIDHEIDDFVVRSEVLAAPAHETVVDDGYWADLGEEPAMAPANGADALAADVAATPYSGDVIEPPTVMGSFVEPSVDEYLEQDDELVNQDFADAIPVTTVAAEPVAQASPPVFAAAAQPSLQNHADGLDELLVEVERYPVVDNTARWGVHSKPIAAEDVVRATPPLVQDFVAPPAVTKAVEPAEQVAEAFAVSDEMTAEPDIDESHFDIDLGEIELDLADLNEGHISASSELLADLANEPVAVRVEPVAPPAVTHPTVSSPPARITDTDYSSLPFDPSQITQEEETFEAIAEMDVPEVPVVHEEEKPAPHPEYDLDLDAEMAQLFVTAKAQSTTSYRVGQTTDTPISFDGVARPSQPSGLDLDDFERALEEDFRRAFAENRPTSSPDRVPLAPVYEEPEPTRSRRPVLLASAAIAILLFGGAGVFAFMSGDTKILTSSEPKVILADTEPVKVVPVNPGGKQVPNEDKAVYDRVAGTTPGDAKQERLVTSNEEPVDVVQRTLMPESLPMDDDTLAAATPTGDTIDPRLLPDEEEQDRVSTTKKVVSGVSPRKVKTMVVRPDGTLVEREVTEEDLKQQATNDAELMKIAQKAAVDAATASDSSGDDIAKAIENVPERLAASDQTTAKPADVADDAAAPLVKAEPDPTADIVAETPSTVVPPVDPVVIEDEKPADAAKTDVATTESKPEPVATEEKPVELASETKPADTVTETPVERSIAVEQTADNADAVAKVANADVAADDVVDAPVRKVKTTKITPVPEVRPVDQPVTVVGTVTDQGTVRSDTDAKTQEVALADPVQKPAETTALPAGSYVIQIASLPSEAEAQTSYSRLSSKFAGIIGGKGVDIRRAEIKNKGTYYRVRIPAGSKQEAQALCSQYKAAGGACLVSK